MADASCTSTLTNILPYVGSLFGVAVGAGLTWLLQRNEWGRQRRWELRRDAVLDAIRAHADLEYTLINLNSVGSTPADKFTDETAAALSAASQRFRDSRYLFMRAYRVADVAVGGRFSNALSAYFLLTGAVSKDMTHKKSFLDSVKSKELALRGNDVILSARKALGIKDAGDLTQFGDSN